jgi:protein-S-isoprenylcysteine O-methyltransferase Ste14
LSYASVAQRVRVPLGLLLALLYLLFARPTPLSFAVGATVALAGLLMRAWAAGHLVKNRELATTGPYAHTRNPLYLGSFLIAAGFAIIAHWGLLLAVIALFVAVYAPVIDRERRHIGGRFPDYAEYARHVPAFVPRPLPWRGGGSDGGFSLGLYMRHREWRAAVAFVAVITFLLARMRGWR